MLAGAAALSPPARAGESELLITILEDDNTLTMLYRDNEDGHFWCIFVSADRTVYTVYDPTNPNPEDTAAGPGSHSDKPDVAGLIKSGAATYTVHIAPADSPELMAHLQGAIGDAGGLGPHYNPSDDDNGSGPGAASTHSLGVTKTPDEIREQIRVANEIANELATLGSSMGDGDEGGGESPTGFNKDGSPGGTGNDDGDYTEGQNKSVGKTEKDLLGAKPEYVNPPHWGSDTATHGGSSRGGSGAGGGSLGGGAHGATSTHG
jgi:hypothetical protein